MILNNPFNRIGLPADASVRDFTRRLGRIKALMTANMPIEFDEDLCLGKVRRDAVAFEHAEHSLETAMSKLEAGLFWFTSSGVVDDIALQALRTGDFREALNIWERAAKRPIISNNYISCLNNLGTLQLAFALLSLDKTAEREERKLLFLDGLANKFALFDKPDTEVQREFFETIGDSIASGQSTLIRESFVARVIELISDSRTRRMGISTPLLIERFKDEIGIGKFILDHFRSQLIQELEDLLNKAEQELGWNEEDLLDTAKLLKRKAKPILQRLRDVSSSNDARLSMLTDRVADVMLSLAVKHYNGLAESDDQEVLRVIKVVQSARKMATGVAVIQRLDESHEALVSQVSQTKLNSKIEKALRQFDESIKAAQKCATLNATAKVSAELSGKTGAWGIMRSLRQIEGIGYKDLKDQYLLSPQFVAICDAAFNIMLSLVIDEVNELQQKGRHDILSHRSNFERAKHCLFVMKSMVYVPGGAPVPTKLPVERSTFARIVENHSIISETVGHLEAVLGPTMKSQPPRSSRTSKPSKPSKTTKSTSSSSRLKSTGSASRKDNSSPEIDEALVINVVWVVLILVVFVIMKC